MTGAVDKLRTGFGVMVIRLMSLSDS